MIYRKSRTSLYHSMNDGKSTLYAGYIRVGLNGTLSAFDVKLSLEIHLGCIYTGTLERLYIRTVRVGTDRLPVYTMS